MSKQASVCNAMKKRHNLIFKGWFCTAEFYQINTSNTESDFSCQDWLMLQTQQYLKALWLNTRPLLVCCFFFFKQPQLAGYQEGKFNVTLPSHQESPGTQECLCTLRVQHIYHTDPPSHLCIIPPSPNCAVLRDYYSHWLPIHHHLLI